LNQETVYLIYLTFFRAGIDTQSEDGSKKTANASHSCLLTRPNGQYSVK
jgi:hypothetical protein